MKRLRIGLGARACAGMVAALAAGGLGIAQTAAGPRATTATAAVGGVLLGPTGLPLVGAQVRLDSRSGPRFSVLITTGLAGAFTFPSVPGGTYAVCPDPPDSSSVSPCDWGAEPHAAVSAVPVTVAAIRLLPAADLYIRVNDPNGTRAATEGKAPGAGMLLAARAPNGNLFPIPVTTRDATGYNHHLPVPTGVSISLVARSNSYSLTNSALAPISQLTGLLSTVTIPAGTAQHAETINIR